MKRDDLRKAIIDAAAKLARVEARLAARSGPPAPGDVYQLDELAWLVVRAHPEDPELLLMIPVDDFPLAGTCDVRLEDPWVARCGYGDWIMIDAETPRVDCIAPEDLARVRREIAALARGLPSPGRPEDLADEDPEYWEWLGFVEKQRQRLG